MVAEIDKSEIIKKFRTHDKDTGSVQAQVALLTQRIRNLLLHLKEHKKDLHSKRGLLKLISKRKKLLKYLKENYPKDYEKLIKELNIKG
jgi:small subunit ribosomal protein S15